MPDTSPFSIPDNTVCLEEVIKKSRFLTYLAHTPGSEAALAYIRQLKSEHPAARHHCSAFIAGEPGDGQQWGFSDDGEPSGTAGKPMLAQLQGSGIGEICAVVVRYYGGIRLGTGGLVKAYGGGVAEALKQLQRREKIPQRQFTLHCDYSMLKTVEYLLAQYAGVIDDRCYTDTITLQCSIDNRCYSTFCQQLLQATDGQLQPEG